MTSWAQEMENILLAWFILVKTQSVVMLTLFGALTYLGTLMAPVLGVTGQRIGNKKTYCALRAGYTVTALVTMTLALTLHAREGRTRLEIRQGAFPAEMAAMARGGWESSLAKLQAVLGGSP